MISQSGWRFFAASQLGLDKAETPITTDQGVRCATPKFTSAVSFIRGMECCAENRSNMKLNTIEKFLLIAHHPEKGKFIISDMHINYGIIGAVLLEMSLTDKFDIDKDRLILKNNIIVDNPIISDVSTIIANSKKERKTQYWITKLVGKSQKYKWIILNELVSKQLIRIENKRFLGLIPYRKSYLIERETRVSLIRQFKNNILLLQELRDEDVVFAGLIEACNMHKIITKDKDELKKLKKELNEIIKGSPLADTIEKTIKQIEAAAAASSVYN